MKIKKRYTVEDLHAYYINDPHRRGHIPPGPFTKMFLEITALHIKEIVWERGIWRLPNMMGILALRKINIMPFIASRKKSKTGIDHKASALFGQKVYYMNLETGGYKFGMQWKRNRNYQRFSNHMLYSIKIGPLVGKMIQDAVTKTTRNLFKKSIDAPLKITI